MRLVAIYGSPRQDGNTSVLLKEAVKGAKKEGAQVEEFVLRNLKMSPCLEIYACKDKGRCIIKDDFQVIYDQLLECEGLMLASPIFFYTVSAHTKIFMDRCQSFWAKKYWIEKVPFTEKRVRGKGLFICVGATNGKRLFDGTLLTVKYFFEALDMEVSKTLLYRGLDFKGDVLKYPQYVEDAFQAGKELVHAIKG
ncbi:MAG: flavodoxin family protein [Thermodesulfobacteriota bacterium]|nr:flavodoxin family protein [Thermodesulfobacteriota bacterium]